MDIDWTNMLQAWFSAWLGLAVYVGFDWYREGELTRRKWHTLIQGFFVLGLCGVVGLLFWVLTTHQ